MPTPTPKDGDAASPSGPLGAPTNRKPQQPDGPQWRSLGSGRYVDKDGRLKYTPAEDPAHPYYRQGP